MIEIEPWKPYTEDVKYPVLAADGTIDLAPTRHSIFGVHTAGVALDETPFETPFPFPNAGEEPALEGYRYLDFIIQQHEGAFFMPDSCALYADLAAQMLGALYYEGDAQPAKHHGFTFIEQVTGMASYGDNVHDDDEHNTPRERAVLVANIFPTMYAMQSLNRFVKGRRRLAGVDFDKIPPHLWWCPRPLELTVQQGQTPHARPPFPKGAHAVRRSAQLRVARDDMPESIRDGVEIDDLLFTDEEAKRELVDVKLAESF